MIEVLNQLASAAFGIIIVLGLMAFIYKRHAVDWEGLVAVYGRAWQQPPLRKRFGNMVLYSEGRPAKPYNGVLDIGLFDDGIALRPSPLFRPFHAPIFIPYADIEGWSQHWYLNAKSAELVFRKAPHLRLIMPRKQVEWMGSLSRNPIPIAADSPPNGRHPTFSFVIAVAFGVLALGVLAYALVMGKPLTRQGMADQFRAVTQEAAP